MKIIFINNEKYKLEVGSLKPSLVVPIKDAVCVDQFGASQRCCILSDLELELPEAELLTLEKWVDTCVMRKCWKVAKVTVKQAKKLEVFWKKCKFRKYDEVYSLRFLLPTGGME